MKRLISLVVAGKNIDMIKVCLMNSAINRERALIILSNGSRAYKGWNIEWNSDQAIIQYDLEPLTNKYKMYCRLSWQELVAAYNQARRGK